MGPDPNSMISIGGVGINTRIVMEILVETVLNANGLNVREQDAYRKKFQSSFNVAVCGDEESKDDILPNTKKRKHFTPQGLSSTKLCNVEYEDEQDWIYKVFRRGHV